MSATNLETFNNLFVPARRPMVAAFGLCTALLLVFFWDALGNLWYRWGAQQELSHSYFIPLISAWLVWVNRDAITKSIGEPSAYGLALLAVAGVMAWIGQITYIYVLQHLAIVISIGGLAATFGGISFLRVTGVSIAHLFFAVPPPFWALTVLSWKFQQMSSVLGVWMIELMDIPVYLSGNVIDLGEYKLAVAEACSGLRYLFPFLSIGVIAAYLFRGPFWGKVVITLATIPITIIMNSFRIAITGALVQAYGPEHAEGALHFFEGWVVFILCLIMLFGVIWAIARFGPVKMKASEALGPREFKPITPSRGSLSRLPAAGGFAAMTLAFLAIAQTFSIDNLIIPERKQFAELPNEFPEWKHEVRPMAAEVAEVLDADDSIVFDLVAPGKAPFNVYVSYFEAQRDGRSWHSPRQCIPGGGWEIASHDILPVAGDSSKHFNRLVIERRNARYLVYYYYDQRGRTIANEFVMKFLLMFDAVVRNRADGSMVRLMTPILKNEPIDAADARLTAMMARMDETLTAYVPN